MRVFQGQYYLLLTRDHRGGIKQVASEGGRGIEGTQAREYSTVAFIPRACQLLSSIPTQLVDD